MSVSESVASSCFDDIISLRGTCDDITPTSGLWINDVGVSLQELNELVTEDYKGGYDLFQKKLAFTIEEVTKLVHSQLQPKYKARSVIENQRTGFYKDNLVQIPAIAGYNKLLQYEIINHDSYLDMFVSELSLQLDYTGDVDVSVFNLLTGTLIDTITVPCVADQISTVYPNKTYKSNRHRLNLIFSYDSTGKTSNTSTLLSTGNCSGCSAKNQYSNQYMRVSSGKMDATLPKIKSNILPTSDTGGMSIVYSLSCDHKSWLCSIQNVIALPILWKTAAAIMDHGINIAPLEQMTARSQSSHLLDARRKEYMDKFYESFNSVLQNIVLPSDEKCFICNSRIKHLSVIPS